MKIMIVDLDNKLLLTDQENEIVIFDNPTLANRSVNTTKTMKVVALEDVLKYTEHLQELIYNQNLEIESLKNQ